MKYGRFRFRWDTSSSDTLHAFDENPGGSPSPVCLYEGLPLILLFPYSGGYVEICGVCVNRIAMPRPW